MMRKKELTAVKEGYNDDGTRDSLLVHRDRTKSNRYSLEQWKLWLNYKEK